MELIYLFLHFILRLLLPLLQVAIHQHLFRCIVYYVHRVIGLFGVYLPLFDPHILNVLQLGCNIICMSYIYCCKVGLIIKYLLVLLFGALADIFIIIAILVQCLLFFCVLTH